MALEIGDLVFPTFKTFIIFWIWTKSGQKMSRKILRKNNRKLRKSIRLAKSDKLKLAKIEIVENENVENSRSNMSGK